MTGFKTRPMMAMGAAFVCLSHAAQAVELDLPPTAQLIATNPAEDGSHLLATGPFADGILPVVEPVGQVQSFIWQVPALATSIAGLADLVRAQLGEQGFEPIFACQAAQCGGFDFRHGLPLGQAPDMFIDLGDFHYVSLERANADGTDYAALIVSRGSDTGYVHLALVRPPGPAVLPPVTQSSRDREPDATILLPEESPPVLSVAPGGLIDALIEVGSAPLDDLRFETGASALSGARYASLSSLAAFLNADPTQRVVLVGHTDAMGSLEANIALSRARAEAVRLFLTNDLGVDVAQVAAEGIGFLAPRAPNTDAQGREANRRVEVVLATPE